MRASILVLLASLLAAPAGAGQGVGSKPYPGPPKDFREAKRALDQLIYFKPYQRETLYCGCPYSASKRIDLDACGLSELANTDRGARVEWDHALPMSWLKGGFSCYRERPVSQGGRRPDGESPRQYCGRIDPNYSLMEADMHNLWPSEGELNRLRSDRGVGMIPGEDRIGQCDVEMSEKVWEPRPEARGRLARSILYMSERYQVRLSSQNQQLYRAWNRQYPPDAWEKQRNSRIEVVQGNRNPYIDQ